MEIKNENGKLKTLEELYDEVKELIVDELDTMNTEDALYLGNEIRDCNSYALLYENKEGNLNDVLEGLDPADLIRMGSEDWDNYSDFFTYDYDLNMTDDVWYNLDTDEIAGDILEGSYRDHITYDIKDIIDEYEEAKEEIENYNPYRAMCEEVVAKYVNCEADVTDLLQTLDKLAKSDEAWEGN